MKMIVNKPGEQARHTHTQAKKERATRNIRVAETRQYLRKFN